MRSWTWPSLLFVLLFLRAASGFAQTIPTYEQLLEAYRSEGRLLRLNYTPKFAELSLATEDSQTRYRCCMWVIQDGLPRDGVGMQQALKGMLRHDTSAFEMNEYYFLGPKLAAIPLSESVEALTKLEEAAGSDEAREFTRLHRGRWFANMYTKTWTRAHSPVREFEQGRTILASLVEQAHDNSVREKAMWELDRLRRSSPGQTAPEIAQNNTRGTMMKLSDFRGTPVLLYFGGGWCGPCRQFHERLPEYLNKYADRLQILGVNSDEDPALRNEMRDTPIPSWEDGSTKGPIQTDWKVSSSPTFVLIDAKGMILARLLGTEQLDNTLEKLLSEP